MTTQSRVLWALVASALVHAALAAGLSLWTARGVAVGAAAPGRTRNVLYASMDCVAEQPGKLAPGDSGAGPASMAMPRLPIDVQVGSTELGPTLSVANFATLAVPSRGPLGQEAGQEFGSGGGTATTTFFGVPAHGQRIVYVLDRSGSMGLHRALDVARRELTASLSQLPATACFQVIDYNTAAEPLLGRPGELLTASADNIRRATLALDALAASGTTRHLPALTTALALDPEVMYFLTDADDLDNADRIRVTRLNGGRCVIHTIELTTANRGNADMPMQRLAHDNRGTYRAIDLFR